MVHINTSKLYQRTITYHKKIQDMNSMNYYQKYKNTTTNNSRTQILNVVHVKLDDEIEN